MRYRTEFLCPFCFEEWEQDWVLPESIVCPKCGREYEAVWQVNAAGNLIGPWIGRALGQSEASNPGPSD